MTINDQISEEKIQHVINREAAKISALSSGKIHRYEYLTREDIWPSNRQQITEQAKFTYSPLEKAFEKQIKIIEDQGKKQVKVLEDFKPKEQRKSIEDKSNNQPKAIAIFNDLINKRKEIISELYDSVDYNNLKFEYVRFSEYIDSKELFNKIKNNQIKVSEVENKQNEFLNKLTNIKIGKKTTEQKIVIMILINFTVLEKKLLIFLETIMKMLSDANYDARKNKTEETRLKILSPKQMLQRLPIALAQVKAGNNSEILLNEIRQIVYKQ